MTSCSEVDSELLDQAVAFAEMWGTEQNWPHVRDAYVAAIMRERAALVQTRHSSADPICRQCASQEHGDTVPEECTCSEAPTLAQSGRSSAEPVALLIARNKIIADAVEEDFGGIQFDVAGQERFTLASHLASVSTILSPPVGPQEAVAVTDEMVRKASNEYLMHKGERPWRVLRGGQELWETCALAMRAALVAALSPSGIDLGGEVERLTRERDTWKWAVEKKDKQLLEFAAHIEAARPLAEFAGALAALRQHHEQALAMMDDEYPDSPLYAETVDALAVKAHDAPTKTLMDNVRIVYDTFKRDLEQGYRTKDKTFAVELLGSALASLSNAVREGDDG